MMYPKQNDTHIRFLMLPGSQNEYLDELLMISLTTLWYLFKKKYENKHARFESNLGLYDLWAKRPKTHQNT